MSSPTISVVICLWNSEMYLPRCLAALAQQTFVDFEVLLIDNGSDDNGVDEQELHWPALDLRVKRFGENKGFAVANNTGALLAQGQWLALLNADAFPKADWLEQLVKAAELYPNSFFASRQIQERVPNYLDGEGDVYHVSGLAWRKNYGASVYSLNEPQLVFSSCGAAAFYPRHAFLDAGGFDEDYFSYHEDVDLGYRLRLRGLKCMLVPSAVVHHVGSASTGRKSDFSLYYGHRNLVWTYWKDMPWTLFWLYLPLHFAVNCFSLLYFTVRGQGRAIWRAKLDALRGLPTTLKKRRFIQRDRRVSISELHRVMSRNWLTPFLELIRRQGE